MSELEPTLLRLHHDHKILAGQASPLLPTVNRNKQAGSLQTGASSRGELERERRRSVDNMREDRAIKREINTQSSCQRKTTGSSSFVLPPTCWASESLSYLYVNNNNDDIKDDDDDNELASDILRLSNRDNCIRI